MNVTIEKTCPVCHKTSRIEVDEDAYDAYTTPREWGGKLIQDAFPNLSPGEREQIKTGIHPECWDKLFGGPRP